MKLVLVTAIVLCALSSLCTADTTDASKLVRTWKITKYKSTEDMSAAQLKERNATLVNSTFEFRGDSTCTMTVGKRVKNGTWRVDGNLLVLIDPSGTEEIDTLSTLTDKLLVLANKEGASITLVPAKNSKTATIKPPPVPSGNADRNTLITRKWQITKFDIPGIAASERKRLNASLKTASFDFRSDGTTTMIMAGMTKTGTWRIEGDNLVLVDESGTEEKNKITTLSQTALHIVGENNGSAITVEMKPAK